MVKMPQGRCGSGLLQMQKLVVLLALVMLPLTTSFAPYAKMPLQPSMASRGGLSHTALHIPTTMCSRVGARMLRMQEYGAGKQEEYEMSVKEGRVKDVVKLLRSNEDQIKVSFDDACKILSSIPLDVSQVSMNIEVPLSVCHPVLKPMSFEWHRCRSTERSSALRSDSIGNSPVAGN